MTESVIIEIAEGAKGKEDYCGMTVKELIENLEKFDKTLKVAMWNGGYNYYINNVALSEDESEWDEMGKPIHVRVW